jgi:hypothetical protein
LLLQLFFHRCLQFNDFIAKNGTLSMSWYRGNWAAMTVGSAPIFRFVLQNPAKLSGKVELIWEPTYDYNNIVPTNTWRTDTVSLNKVCAAESDVDDLNF